MESLDLARTRKMLMRVADVVIDNQDLLTEVDGKIGDADHGIGMAGGMRMVKQALEDAAGPASANELFRIVGRTMLMNMGGASGVIFGSMFQGGCKTAPVSQRLDAPTLRALMRGGLESVKDRGKAQVGDKTMVDALEPAVIALECGGEKLVPLLEAATEAAWSGMEETKKYPARFGRAKALMERSIGHQDAGATSVWLIFTAMRDYIRSEAEND